MQGTSVLFAQRHTGEGATYTVQDSLDYDFLMENANDELWLQYNRLISGGLTSNKGHKTTEPAISCCVVVMPLTLALVSI